MGLHARQPPIQMWMCSSRGRKLSFVRNQLAMSHQPAHPTRSPRKSRSVLLTSCDSMTVSNHAFLATRQSAVTQIVLCNQGREPSFRGSQNGATTGTLFLPQNTLLQRWSQAGPVLSPSRTVMSQRGTGSTCHDIMHLNAGMMHMHLVCKSRQCLLLLILWR